MLIRILKSGYSLAALLSLGVLGVSGLRASTIISVQFLSVNSTHIDYTGTEPDAVAADPAFSNSNQWNHLTDAGSFALWSNLVDSTGANSGASVNIPGFVPAGYNDFSHALPDTYLDSLTLSQQFTISGLAPNASFTLFIYAFNSVRSPNDRGEVFTVGSSTFDTATGHPNTEDPTHATDGFITGVTSSTGTIGGTWARDAQNTVREIDWSGFQLRVASPVSAPEPGTFVLLIGGLSLGALLRRINRIR